jgi:hypothetical protein
MIKEEDIAAARGYIETHDDTARWLRRHSET